MITLKIDNSEYRVPEGISVMGAARMHGIDVPSMCYREGKPHFTSCMICMVKDRKSGKLFPSCSVKAMPGMDIISSDEEVVESRKMALELLLSEHVGDCEAPCTITCPAHMNIPLMNRLLAAGRFEEAADVARKDIALPAVFGYICPAPCEGACHRKSLDSPVSICLLKRFAGKEVLSREHARRYSAGKPTGKKVLVIGAGAAGLAGAYYLAMEGHQVEVADRHSTPGGSLLKEVSNGVLPEQILQQETELIRDLGVNFRQEEVIDSKAFSVLCKSYDAVLVATGTSPEQTLAILGLDAKQIKKNTYKSDIDNVFVAGSALKTTKLAIRAHGQGKDAARSINGFLRGEKDHCVNTRFNSRFGKLLPKEADEYLKDSSSSERVEPSDGENGLTHEQVTKEAARCMHCDCRKPDHCILRDLSEFYGASQKHYWNPDRKLVQRHVQHADIVYEPSKCIKCGKCVEITREQGEEYGFSFIGRGFEVVVGVPFNETIKQGLREVGKEVAAACPTGALALK